MFKPQFSFALLGMTGLLLSACAASDGRYPSLAVRDAERVSGELTPSPATQPPVEPVASPQDVADLVSAAYGAQQQFEEARPGAERLARSARGAGAESDTRARALVAVAELTSLRGETALVLARLDALKVEALTTFAPAEAITSGQTSTANLLRQQDEVLDSLSEMLAR